MGGRHGQENGWEEVSGEHKPFCSFDRVSSECSSLMSRKGFVYNAASFFHPLFDVIKLRDKIV